MIFPNKIRFFYEKCTFYLHDSKKCTTFAAAFKESCLSGRKSHTRNVVYPLRGTGGSNPSLSA